MPNIQIRTADDWVAVYLDGRKVFENHSCSLVDGLRALGMGFHQIDMDPLIEGDLLAGGSDPFPAVLPPGQGGP